MNKTAPFALVEAFCSQEPGTGNPAGVVLLDAWLSDQAMQTIASTVNQAETAFVCPEDAEPRIRWFTPTTEVRLCGHATLSAAALLAEPHSITFQSLSGPLTVFTNQDSFALDFPSHPANPVSSEPLQQMFPHARAILENRDDWLVILNSVSEVAQVQPNFAQISLLGKRGLSISASDEPTSFAYRFFAPQAGVPEDHATGSAQTYLTPYWSLTHNQKTFTSIQLSPRTGHFRTELQGDRVRIAGYARILVRGKINI